MFYLKVLIKLDPKNLNLKIEAIDQNSIILGVNIIDIIIWAVPVLQE